MQPLTTKIHLENWWRDIQLVFFHLHKHGSQWTRSSFMARHRVSLSSITFSMTRWPVFAVTTVECATSVRLHNRNEDLLIWLGWLKWNPMVINGVNRFYCRFDGWSGPVLGNRVTSPGQFLSRNKKGNRLQHWRHQLQPDKGRDVTCLRLPSLIGWIEILRKNPGAPLKDSR